MSTTAIETIQHGIVFLMAEWSGGAKWAHEQLVMALEQRGIPLEHLHVLDVDRHPELYDLPEFVGRIHGGERRPLSGTARLFLSRFLGRTETGFRSMATHCSELMSLESRHEPDLWTILGLTLVAAMTVWEVYDFFLTHGLRGAGTWGWISAAAVSFGLMTVLVWLEFLRVWRRTSP